MHGGRGGVGGVDRWVWGGGEEVEDVYGRMDGGGRRGEGLVNGGDDSGVDLVGKGRGSSRAARRVGVMGDADGGGDAFQNFFFLFPFIFSLPFFVLSVFLFSKTFLFFRFFFFLACMGHCSNWE